MGVREILSQENAAELTHATDIDKELLEMKGQSSENQPAPTNPAP